METQIKDGRELTSRSSVESGSWVIVRADSSLGALPASAVHAMVMLPKVVAVPHMPPHLRGVVNLRGQVLPLVDLRMRCGLRPLADYITGLCKLLEQREQDHRNWLTELDKSVTDHRPFTLATDPHKCAFGQWYDHFHTDDLILTGLLRRFDEPHRAVHAVAARVEQLKTAGDFTGATNLIAQTRSTELAKLMDLFAATRHHLRSASREIVVVLECRQGAYALAVDNVESTEYVEPASVSTVPDVMTGQCRQLVRGVARRKKGEQMVLLLDVDALFCDAVAEAA